MIQTRCLGNVVIFIQAMSRFELSRKLTCWHLVQSLFHVLRARNCLFEKWFWQKFIYSVSRFLVTRSDNIFLFYQLSLQTIRDFLLKRRYESRIQTLATSTLPNSCLISSMYISNSSNFASLQPARVYSLIVYSKDVRISGVTYILSNSASPLASL